MTAIVSKIYCSSKEVVLEVRTRPQVVGGGGFVVTDLVSRQVVFTVDGCGVVGKHHQLILNDAHANPLLLIRRKGGIVEALSMHKEWKGYKAHWKGYEKLVFTLKEGNSMVGNKSPITRVWVEEIKDRYFDIKGYFPDRDCTIIDSKANLVAQVGVSEQVKMENKDVYQVVVKQGVDQAFVFALIAILDYIYDGSTTC